MAYLKRLPQLFFEDRIGSCSRCWSNPGDCKISYSQGGFKALENVN